MIYAINRRTKEHKPEGEMPRLADGWRIVEADAEGWIPWEGGECPLPKSSWCGVRANGCVFMHESANEIDWSNVDAYRPILDAKPDEMSPEIAQYAKAWREHYGESAKPQAPEWDGEGLPPVGVECEYYWQAGDEYREGVVLAHHGGAAVIRDAEDWVFEGCFTHQVRAIRSEEERAVDEMIQASGMDNDGDYRNVCAELYRAGYRKQ